MRRRVPVLSLARSVALSVGLAVVVSGCIDNSAPGNDREAGLEPPAPPAELASAAAALDGVATGLLMPEIMPDADVARIPDIGDRCAFRMTRVGFPVFVYGTAGIVKLNGKLVPLDRTGDGQYAAGGIRATVRPLEDADAGAGGEPFPAEFVVRLPGAPNELGFHGFARCPRG